MVLSARPATPVAMRPASALLIIIDSVGGRMRRRVHAQVPGEVRIAALLPLTGELAPLGAQLNHAVRLAVQTSIHIWRRAARSGGWAGYPWIREPTPPWRWRRSGRCTPSASTSWWARPARPQLASILSHMDDNNMVAVSPASTAQALAIPGDSAFRTVPRRLPPGEGPRGPAGRRGHGGCHTHLDGERVREWRGGRGHRGVRVPGRLRARGRQV